MTEPTHTCRSHLATLRDHKASQFVRRWIYLIGYRIFRLSGEIFAVVMGLGIAWLYGASFLLTQQSMDLSVMKPWAEQGFSKAFKGHKAEIAQVNLNWLPSEGAISLKIDDIKVKDEAGIVQQSFPNLRVDFDSQDALQLKSNPTNIDLRGGVLTALIEEDGQVVVGLGTPETVGRFGPVYRGQNGKSEPRKLPKDFERFSIQDGKVFVEDRQRDMSLALDIDDLTLLKSVESLSLSLEGRLNQRGKAADVNVLANTNASRTTVSVAFQGEDIRLDEVAPKLGRYKDLRRIAAPIDLVLEADLKRGESLRSALVDLSVGNGEITGFKFDLPLRSFLFEGLLTPGKEVLDVSNIALNSDRVKFNGSGIISELGALNDGNPNSSPLFDISLRRADIDATPVFESPFEFSTVQTKGRLDFDAQTLDLEKLLVAQGEFTLSTSGIGKLEAGKISLLQTQGQIDGKFTPKDLVAIWPVKFADGARRWMERSAMGGLISPLTFRVDVDSDFFANPILTPKRVELNFGLIKNDVKYIGTMSPAIGVDAVGRISGNQLTMNFEGGQVDNLQIDNGVVTIPQLIPKGGDITIKASGRGQASDMMTLINQPPFQFADKYGVNPQDIGGQGVVTAKITRPLLEFFDQDRIEYEIEGDFTDAIAPFKLGSHPIHRGTVRLSGNKTGVHVAGPAFVGPWPAQIEWHEYLGTDTRPTEYKISGEMNRDILDEFGLGLRQFFDGTVAVKVDAFGPQNPVLSEMGSSLVVESGKISVDLKDAELAFGEIWSKSSGEMAEITMKIAQVNDDFIRFSDIKAAAPGLDMSGDLDMARNFRLLNLDMSKVKVDGLIDAALQLKPDADQQKLSLFIEGDYLDVSPWTNSALNQRSSSLDVPLLMTSSVSSLYLKPDYMVSDARILLSHTGQSVSDFRLAGTTPDGPLVAEITSEIESGNRLMSVTVPQASKAAKAFLGLQSTRKGKLELRAKLPPIDQVGPMVGQAEVSDIYMLKTPFLAQILSLASLTGMSDMLSGEGLRFEKMEVPFTLTESDMIIRDARLVGPVLGMTGDGDISFQNRTLDFDGTLVPAYTANNILGDIPLIGDIFVGKKGSGIFALTYTVKGHFEKTQISVNPLSALAPGFLKGIFKSDKKGLSDEILADIEAVKPKAEEPNP